MFRNRTFLLLLPLVVVIAGCSGPSNSASGDPDILFEERFDELSSGSWRTESDESGTSSINNGAMVIEIKTPNILQYTTLTNNEFTEFDLGVDATFMDSTPSSTLGVLVRVAGPEDFLRFEITADGRYMVEGINPVTGWVRHIDDWKISPAIVTGLGAANRLRVVAAEAEISFYANDELLLTVPDSPELAGQIGLDAGTFGEPGTRAAFDNLTIRLP